MRNTIFLATEEKIFQAFKEGNWVIVTDGSYHPDFNIGTAAVIIEHRDGFPLLQSWVKTPGNGDDINAYRLELIGVYCGCLIIRLFENFFSSYEFTTCTIP